jgi:hypothetical protein
MAFVQVIEFKTDDIAPVKATDESWQRATEGKRTARRQMLARDHNDPDRYFALVFFDSYESAMANSKLPETQEAANKYMALTEGEPTFYDLDIIDDRS